MIEARIDERALRRLIDRDEIVRVLHNYTDLLDRSEFDEMAKAAFTVDAVEDHGIGRPVGHGRAEIADARRTRHTQTAGAMHVISNIMIDFSSDDEADVQSYIRTYAWLPNDVPGPRPVDFVLIGLFLDRFRRTDEGWRIYRRRRRNLGPSPFAFGKLPEFLYGTGGPRDAQTP